MAFRFLALLSILAFNFVAALDYDYTAPNTPTQTAPQINNVASDVNSFSAATSIGDSEATPAGYDYTPQAAQTAQTHTTTPSQVHVAQQQFTVAQPVEYWPPAKYEYSYGVNDAYTGDIKSHSESRDGYFVRGTYSVVDPDGYERIVTYTADDVNGFNAVVNRKPYISNILKSNPVVEFHQTESALPTVAHTQDSNHVDTTVQQHDSYATPPTQQQSNGPYP